MKTRRKEYYERIIKNYPSTDPISVLAELLLNMEDMASDYRQRTKNLESFLNKVKQTKKSFSYGNK